MYSGYSGHVYSGHSDIVATLPGTTYIYSIIFRSDIVANQIEWPQSGGPRWPLYPKCTVVQAPSHKLFTSKCQIRVMSYTYEFVVKNYNDY